MLITGLELNSDQDAVSLLIFGTLLCSLAAIWAYMGKAWLRFGGWVYLDKDPKRFWLHIAVHLLLGVGLIGYYLYLTNRLPN